MAKNLRVIAGTAKGRRLAAPRDSSIRPSSERVRGAIFSILESAGADMSQVLDLYAGTGAFGIEALSRGAGWVDFVEQDPKHISVIHANLRSTGLQERSKVYGMSAQESLGKLKNGYGVVFMDPPYADTEVGQVLNALTESGLVSEGTIIVVEHSKWMAFGESYGRFDLAKTRRYGDTILSIYQQEATI